MPSVLQIVVPCMMLALVGSGLAGCGGAEARKTQHLQRGEAFLAAGNLEKARVEFQNALQIAPKDAVARFQMGVIDERLGNVRAAAQLFQGAIEVQPDYPAARARLARIYLFTGSADKALETVQPGLDKHPNDPALLTMRAAVRVQQKDPSGALADAESAVKLAPSDEDAIATLAGVYKSEDQLPKAQALLEESIAKNPATVDLRFVLAQVYAQENRPADVEAQLLKIVELKPADKANRIRLAQFYLQTKQDDAAEATLRKAIKDLPNERDLKLSLVQFLAERRSHDAAEQELKGMIAAAPTDSELKFALAKFYQEIGAPAKAEAVYEQVIAAERLDPSGLTARDRLAALRLQQNDPDGALQLANEVLNASPRDDDALLIRGTIALARKDPRSAISDLRAVLRDQPNAVGVLRSLARAHIANGEPAIAEETMRHAVDANPKNPVLQLEFAELLMQLGKADQAQAIVAQLVKDKPDSVEALDAQYRIAVATKDLATAKTAADAIVALRPKAAVGYMYQGMVAEESKNLDEALRLYTQAADAQPDGIEPLEAVVRLLANSKRLPEAMKRLDDVTAKFPNESLAPTIKGELYLQTGDPAKAKDAFKLAISRTPKWWRPYRGLARAQLLAKEGPAVADATLQNAIPVVEQPEDLQEMLASLLEQQGKPDEAIKQYEAVLKRNPDSDVAVNNLAMLLATYKKDPASLDRAKQLSARFAQSANPSLLDTYGWVLYKHGDAAASVPVLARVVAKAPNAPVARYHLGMAQSSAGDYTDARDNLTRAVNSGAQFSGIDEAKAALARIEKTPSPPAPSPKT
jgi:tetratricopeptide (TPR) repeat protein